MAGKILTTAAIRKFKPAGKRRWIRDAGAQSLFLVIQPSGAKSWTMRFRRPDGKPGKLVLGTVDLSGHELKGDPEIGQPLTLSAARALAASIHRDRARGADVVADAKARRHRQRAELEEHAAGTFGALVRRFIAEHAMIKTRRWRALARVLGLAYPADGGEPLEIRGGLAQRWADRPVRELDGHAIHGAVEEAQRGAGAGVRSRAPGRSEARARSLHAALSNVFGWMLRHRLIEVNPCGSVWRPPPAPPRDRVLSADEIRRLWLACDKLRPAYAAAVRLLLLTGTRLRESTEFEHGELSADGATWTIPGTRTKNRRAHVVPLAPLAREVIAAAPAIAGSRFVFSTDGQRPIAAFSRAKSELDAAMAAPPWRLHDLRRTAVTGMAELGIAPHVIELCVNHTSGFKAGIAGVYNKAEMMPERREALERWSRHVAGLVSPESANKVVTLPRKRGR